MTLKYRWTIFLTAHVGLIIIGFTVHSILQSSRTRSEPKLLTTNELNKPIQKSVTALGKIEPTNKVISLSPPSDFPNARVDKILVKEGDKVKRGQIVAVLDNKKKLQAALQQIKSKVEVTQARLVRVSTGEAKQGEIAARKAVIANLNAQFKGEIDIQKAKISSLKTELLRQEEVQEATIARLKAEWEYTKSECDRYDTLFRMGAISDVFRNRICLEEQTDKESLHEGQANKSRIVETLREQIKEAEASLQQVLSTFPKRISEAEANLNKTLEVRPIDVRVAQAELEQAKSAVTEAEVNLSSAYVKAPVDGQILEIHTFPGERIGSQGIIDLAQTEQMYIVAEVYETEVNKIRINQNATISSSALKKNLSGKVKQIGLEVGKKNVLSNDPTLNVDARVVEVKILLHPSDRLQAAQLINLEVEVTIDTDL